MLCGYCGINVGNIKLNKSVSQRNPLINSTMNTGVLCKNCNEFLMNRELRRAFFVWKADGTYTIYKTEDKLKMFANIDVPCLMRFRFMGKKKEYIEGFREVMRGNYVITHEKTGVCITFTKGEFEKLKRMIPAVQELKAKYPKYFLLGTSNLHKKHVKQLVHEDVLYILAHRGDAKYELLVEVL